MHQLSKRVELALRGHVHLPLGVLVNAVVVDAALVAERDAALPR